MNPDPVYENKYADMLKKMTLEAAEAETCGIFLFGSRASGKERFASDYDIGFVHIEKEAFEAIKGQIQEKLEESIIPWRADIVNFDTASESFRETAMRKILWWKRG